MISVDRADDSYLNATETCISTVGGTYDINFNGGFGVYGLRFAVGDDFISLADTNEVVHFEDVKIIGSSGSKAKATSTTNFRNMEFVHAGTGGAFTGASNMGEIINYRITNDQTVTYLTGSGSANWSSCDFSAITSNIYLTEDTSGSVGESFFYGCALPPVFTYGPKSDTNCWITMNGSDTVAGNDVARHESFTYIDVSTSVSTAVYRSATYDDSTGYSFVLDAGTRVTKYTPDSSEWINGYLGTTGSKTFTVHIVSDSAINLQDDEVWLELEYYADPAKTLTTFVTDRTVDVMATPADQPASTETWTGTGGFSNENKQKLEITATVGRAGPFRFRVGLGMQSTSGTYFCPKIEIS